MHEELIFLNALNRISFLGPVRISAMLRCFGSAKRAFEAKARELELMPELKNLVSRLVAERALIDPTGEWSRLEKLGISCYSLDSPLYPPLLKQVDHPPLLIYCRGRILYEHSATVAVVGSRRCTFYGKEVAGKLAGDLAAMGFSIVSGLALGVDTAAHQGALKAGGHTAAVLGCSVERCYPPANEKLLNGIIDSGGVVISEFPLDTVPLPHHFPQRNRLISGLSLGTVVVEATEKSGALITANYALEQNREVFAVPGNIGSPYSRGCHRLLKEGARLVETVKDILAELPVDHVSPFTTAVKVRHELSGNEERLLELLPYQPILLDDLIRLSGLQPDIINSLLLGLELKGLVRQLPGKYFCRQ